ncbi:MAG: hypothetical protein A2X85_17500 [Geobacteraceae bacterium GWF2_54_21]|nr:MAG: hypothetical protein A2X85_17500 [Geobacteraceae bacterium GWF2_54_21]
MLRKVVSGGQTGVDRAGLDAAVNAGYPIGGYCPKGRLAEDGTIPEKYPMIEMDTAEFCYRTEKNVQDSDGTLILNKGKLTKGTKLTHQYAAKHGKPSLVVQLDDAEIIKPEHVVRWIEGQHINVLNVAGPRESKHPGGIYAEAFEFMERVFSLIKDAV